MSRRPVVLCQLCGGACVLLCQRCPMPSLHVPGCRAPPQDEWLRANFYQEDESFTMPPTKPKRFASLSQEEKDAYYAKLDEKELRDAEGEVNSKWRLDQMRARAMPLWMRYEEAVSTESDAGSDDDELEMDIDVCAGHDGPPAFPPVPNTSRAPCR